MASAFSHAFLAVALGTAYAKESMPWQFCALSTFLCQPTMVHMLPDDSAHPTLSPARHSAHGGSTMTFEEILDQAIAMLQRRGRVAYRSLQRQFQLDEDALNDLKDALLYAHPEVRDDAERGLVWSGTPDTAPPVAPP